MAKRTCAQPDCDRPCKGRGLCGMHYQRIKAGQPVEGPVRRAPRYEVDVVCAADGCLSAARAKGLCYMHWQRQRKGVPFERPRAVRDGSTCSAEGCPTLARSYGLCPKHAERLRRHGDVLTVKTIVKGKCGFDGCGREHYAYGYCHAHGRRLLAGRPLDTPFKVVKRGECLAEGCDKHGRYGGLCATHRDRAKYLADPEPFKARTARRRQRTAELSLEDREISGGYRYAIQNDPCEYCGAADASHTDHFFPLAKGGTDHWWNLTRACADCNRVKWAHCGTWFKLRRGSLEPPKPVPLVA